MLKSPPITTSNKLDLQLCLVVIKGKPGQAVPSTSILQNTITLKIQQKKKKKKRKEIHKVKILKTYHYIYYYYTHIKL